MNEVETQTKAQQLSGRMPAPDSAKYFTASAIGNALAITPQAVRDSLKGVVPDGGKIVAGQEAAAWSLAIIPQPLRKRLDKAAARSGYGYADAMLLAPQRRPALPPNQVSEKDLDYAQKLRTALTPWLAGEKGADLRAAERERLGVMDYQRMFGHPISGRYWRELCARAIQRDGGARDWNRLELYLPSNPTPRAEPSRPVSEEVAEELGRVEGYVRGCANPGNPSGIEKRGIWTLAFEAYAALVRGGRAAKRAARLIRDYLSQLAPFRTTSRGALLKQFNRNLQDMEKANGDAKALRDGREGNGNRLDFCEEDRDKLIGRTVFIYRGGIKTAWRDLHDGGFSEALRQRTRRDRVPACVMDSVRGEVHVLTIMHQGPRAFDAITGFVDRIYDGFYSCDCFMADDFTMPVYFYVPDREGCYRLTRGQILIFIDFRSSRIVGWSMQPERNYTSLVIRSLCTYVFTEHGVPKVLYFEGGVWACSRLLIGRDAAPCSDTEVEQGMREFGIKFINAIRPRTKTVERIGGMLQDFMEAEPGYCGRNERNDAPESLRKQMAEVEPKGHQRAGKIHPSKYFYSYEEWDKRFGEIVDRYNARPQPDSKITGGLSPNEAFAKFANAKDPPMQFTADLRYLLADHKLKRRVTMNGITFRVGKQRFNYRGTEISHLVDEDVLLWFNSENPEIATVTDVRRKNPICVSRSPVVSALQCITDPESEVLAEALKQVEGQASYMKARFHAIKAKYPMPQRILLADARTTRLGQEMREKATRLQEKNRRNEQAVKRARQLGVPAAFVDGDPEAAEAFENMERLRREHSRAPSQSGSPTLPSGAGEDGSNALDSDTKRKIQ